MTTDDQARHDRLAAASQAAYRDRAHQGIWRVVGVFDEDLHAHLVYTARLERALAEKDARIAELKALIDRQYRTA